MESDPSLATEIVGLIAEAVELLVRHPLIGRPVEYPLRELVISRGQTGYVALYSFEQDQDAALVLAIRHQREADYWGEDESGLGSERYNLPACRKMGFRLAASLEVLAKNARAMGVTPV